MRHRPHSPASVLLTGKMAHGKAEQEAILLKTLAEQKYSSSNLKSALKYAKRAHRLRPNLDGLSEMLTAFKILRAGASAEGGSTTLPDWYKILQVEPFSHINSIKKQYKKLALSLHPDKNPFVASEEAFKLVGEAFRVLSDKIRRNEYDMKLRITMQSAATEVGGGSDAAVDAFWTACSTCRLLHQFDRKYLGHNLMCPNCKRSFKALEVPEDAEISEDVESDEEIRVQTRASASVRIGIMKGKRKMSTVGDVLKRSEVSSVEILGNLGTNEKLSSGGGVLKERLRSDKIQSSGNVDACGNLSSVKEILTYKRRQRLRNEDAIGELSGVKEGLRSKIVRSSGNADANGDLSSGGVTEGLRSKRIRSSGNVDADGGLSGGGGVIEGLRSKRVASRLGILDEEGESSSGAAELVNSKPGTIRVKSGEEMMTLAEMQMIAKRKLNEEKRRMKLKEKQKEKARGEEGEKEKENEMEELEKEKEKKEKAKEKRERRDASKGNNLQMEMRGASKSRNLELEKSGVSRQGDLDIMAVEDSDFYDFDKDRVERSFKKGQVWAVYDDDDGMPRHYGLIDEVVSVNPFEVKLNWLDLQNNGDEGLICWEKMGFHIACGRFKISSKTSVNSLNIFSHAVDCERAAREVYRVYPRKGSVWALYNENALDSEGGEVLVKDNRCYDIVVFLTSYSEIHGLSMAYLEKVNGYRSVFRRREIGPHAIRWLEKGDIRLFSHEIPARKLCGEEAPDLSKHCWELDPASLPPELLTIGWGR